MFEQRSTNPNILLPCPRCGELVRPDRVRITCPRCCAELTKVIDERTGRSALKEL